MLAFIINTLNALKNANKFFFFNIYIICAYIKCLIFFYITILKS